MEAIVVKHPLLAHALTVLRDRDTGTADFRLHAGIASQIMLVEATRDLRLSPKAIVTPLTETEGMALDERVVLVPVLRAGLAMLMAIQDMLLDAAVGFVGLERDEKTAVAREYYQKLPAVHDADRVLVLDPMLATGGSLDDTVAILRDRGCRRISLICIVSAPEGMQRIQERYPDIQVYTASMDESLNEQKFIVPGLGDFGDRYFGT
jgi:uracil phosphoribosyltransferase